MRSRRVLGKASTRAPSTVLNASLSTIEWMHTDHLGSTDAITDVTGQVLSRMSFDAWGRRRNPNGTDAGMYAFAFQGGLGAAPSQGFTGHKSLDHLELVHMGGRMYDPVLGRFLSADPYVQFPESTQGFNRYTYVNNNPLSYVDPSGFWSLKKAVKKVGQWYECAFKKVGQWYERLGKKYLTVLVTATIAIAAPPLLPYAITIASGVQTAINGGTMDQVFISAAIALASYHVMEAIHDKIASILEQNGGCFGTGTGGGTLSFDGRDGKEKNSGEEVGSREDAFRGPYEEFDGPVDALIDAKKWVMSQSEESRYFGEYAGEIVGTDSGKYIYETPRYYPGDKAVNFLHKDVVIPFHSHLNGGGEAPSINDFRNLYRAQNRRVGALISPRGDLRLFLRTSEMPRGKFLGVIPLPPRRSDVYWTVPGEGTPYRGR